MNGRRISHARGKVLGGRRSINGMIFQRGNPLDFERWAADPGHGDVGLRPLPAVLQADGDCLAAAPDDPWRGHDGPLVLERGPATNPLFGAFFAPREQAGYASDGRRQRLPPGGLRAVRPEHPPRPALSAARAYLHPVMGRAGTSKVRTRDVREPDPVRRRPGGRRRDRAADGGAPEQIQAGEVILRRRRDQHAPAAAAVRHRAGGRPARARHPGRGRPAGRRRAPPGPPRGLHPAREPRSRSRCSRPRPRSGAGRSSGRSGCSSAAGPGATNHFEAGGFVRGDDDVAYPNLMFHFLPIAIRYDGTRRRGGPRLPGPRRADVLRRPRLGPLKTTDPREHPALRFNYLSTDQDRREWVEAIRVARHILGQPALAPYDGGEMSPGAGGRDRRGGPRLGRSRRRDGLHPSCTARMGVDDASVVDPLTMGVHGVDGLRVVDASAMPYITNGNIYAPVMMLAEKAADLIRRQHAARRRSRSRSTATDVPRTGRGDRPRLTGSPCRPPLRVHRPDIVIRRVPVDIRRHSARWRLPVSRDAASSRGSGAHPVRDLNPKGTHGMALARIPAHDANAPLDVAAFTAGLTGTVIRPRRRQHSRRLARSTTPGSIAIRRSSFCAANAADVARTVVSPGGRWARARGPRWRPQPRRSRHDPRRDPAGSERDEGPPHRPRPPPRLGATRAHCR